MLTIVFLLPFWGVLLVLILHFKLGFQPDDTADIQDKHARISELYKAYSVDEKRADKTVSIEEALLINSASEKRTIIMNVLDDNPREYLEFLQKASHNDDTEVVHYAVTALVEISKENDSALQEFAAYYQENPQDINMLSHYCDFLWSCLSQNLMQGQVEVMNRSLLSQLLQKKMEACTNLEDYSRLAKNELKLQNFDQVRDILAKMAELWPQSEEYILLNILYLTLMHRGTEMHQFISEINNSQMYLSAKVKEALAFWEK
jgi:hypothetical protein